MKANPSLALAAALALAIGVPGIAIGQTHDHDGHDAASIEIVLNEGAKWQGDQNMNDGMAAIRAAIAANLDAVHAGTMTADAASGLAGEVQTQVDFMVENCVLEPEVDEQFHVILGEVLTGIMALEDGEVTEGATTIVGALNVYGDHFEHPGWQPLE